MAEVRAVHVAVDLVAIHPVARVLGHAHERLLHRLREARPARAALELVAAVEQGRVAADGKIHAVLMVVPVGVLERLLGPLAARDLVLLRGQQPLPLGVGVLHLGLAHVDHDVGRQAAGGLFAGLALEGVFGGWRGFHFGLGAGGERQRGKEG